MNITILRTVNKYYTLISVMQKSAFTTVFLIAILLTGAISTALPPMIDTEASSDKKDKKKDKANERDSDKKDNKQYDKKDKRDSDKKDNKQYDKKDKRDSDKKDNKQYDKKDKRDYDNSKYPNKELNKPYPKPYPEPDIKPYPETAKYDDYNKYPNKELNKPYPKPYPEPDIKPYPETAKYANSYSNTYNKDNQPTYNNNNGYDKSSYFMDSNGNRYSDHKDEINKYECRTGPLEGFFVSSVEFCKHLKFDKDDDRKDLNKELNKTNTTAAAETNTTAAAETNTNTTAAAETNTTAFAAPTTTASTQPTITAFAEPTTKASVESYDVKSPKNIKIIDCNNRNINAEGIEDLSTIDPILNQAFNSNIDNAPQSQVYYIGPDTKVIFNCNNQNHNLQPVGNSDVADTNTPTATANTILETATANNNKNTGVNSSTGNLGTGASSALLPSIQQMNPTTQQNKLPSGDPMLQLNLGLSPIL
jgi:hypothetical protein